MPRGIYPRGGRKVASSVFTDQESAAAMADKSEAMKVMREQAQALGIKIDSAWSAEELAQKIIDAQVEASNRADEEFAKAKKVKVRMLRDCWALETRIPTGKTADIPIDLAREWIEAGAAVRADPMPGV